MAGAMPAASGPQHKSNPRSTEKARAHSTYTEAEVACVAVQSAQREACKSSAAGASVVRSVE